MARAIVARSVEIKQHDEAAADAATRAQRNETIRTKNHYGRLQRKHPWDVACRDNSMAEGPETTATIGLN
jgi:hypothetical protein